MGRQNQDFSSFGERDEGAILAHTPEMQYNKNKFRTADEQTADAIMDVFYARSDGIRSAFAKEKKTSQKEERFMPATIKNENGNIIVNDDVIAWLAGYATIENYGIIGMASKTASDGLWQLLGRENLRRGVQVVTQDGNITVVLYVMVQYGVSIIAVAENVIHNVSYKLGEMTGMTVESVNVHVEGVRVHNA